MTRRSRARELATVLETARTSAGDTGDGGLAIFTDDGELVHLAPKSVTSSMRYLLARLQVNDATGLPRRLAFTSALSGEGVTYVVRSLAAVMANDLGKRICVVGLNWWTPPSKKSAIDQRPGVADVIELGADLDDVLVATTNPRLAILPSGSVPVSQRPVLSKATALDATLDQLASRYDHLVLDLPAVGVTGDALALARLSDAVAIVVHQGVTTEAEVREAMDELSGVVSLGVVLNRHASRIPRRIRRALASW